MHYQGPLYKMRVENEEVVHYFLRIGNQEISLNKLIGEKINMHYLKEIRCIKCGRKTSKSFFQGFCYPCFRNAPEADECVIHPERCQAHLGISRDMKWSEEHCLQEHYVYFSITNDLKVGVTRKSQIPVRWIDQGAVRAIKIAGTPNRYNAGIIETALKAGYKDKTNWRRMLLNQVEQGIDLRAEKMRVRAEYADVIRDYFLEDDDEHFFKYPTDKLLTSVKSINLDKNPVFDGVLSGIKGQYLLFSNGFTINIRKYGGYVINLEIG